MDADRTYDVAVVGAGLAGLACGLRLSRSGLRVVVLDRARAVGGRARTVMHEGRPVDLGFQVVCGAYPAVRRLMGEVGLGPSELRPFSAGAVFCGADGWRGLRPTPASLGRFSAFPAADRARLAALGARARGTSPEHWLRDEAVSALDTDTFLRRAGFSGASIEALFRPFWGGVLLDRSLSADAGYFMYLMGMMSRGGAALPRDGLGMIAEWTAAAITQSGGEVRTAAGVAAVEHDGPQVTGVRLEDGRHVRAPRVVLAVDAPATRALLAPVDAAAARLIPAAGTSTVSCAFALARPLYRGRAVVVNAEPPGAGPRVDLLCQTSNLTRAAAVGGPHILVATSVTTDGGGAGPDEIEAAVGAAVGRWAPAFDWRRHATSLGVTEHAFAGARMAPGVRGRLPGHRTALPGLVLAGDLTRHPSIEGAVQSGVAAAAAVVAGATR